MAKEKFQLTPALVKIEAEPEQNKPSHSNIQEKKGGYSR